MSDSVNFEEAVDHIRESDPRYSRAAYIFVQLALDYYRKTHGPKRTNHLTGQELLVGVEELALHQFGPLAPQVLNSWGIHKGEDVGDVVYNLIQHQIMKKSDDDDKDDFGGGKVFDQEMVKDFEW